MKQVLIVLLYVVLFSACEKGEIPVPKYDRGNVVKGSVSLGNDYRWQVWYDLSSNRAVSTNLRTDWDLSFSCDGDFVVYLNSSRLMQATLVQGKSFEEVTNKNGYTFRADHPGRNVDSLSIGNRPAFESVYILDLGLNPDGSSLGFKKIQFISGPETYQFIYADLSGTHSGSAIVSKNNKYNKVAFSFETQAVVFIEPEKSEYDLCFTQYTYYFSEPYIPYLVTGVLINEKSVLVAADSITPFDKITSESLSNYQMTDSLDLIGYTWKRYDFVSSTYVVKPQKNFIIKDTEGFFYKLHFIDFYDENGQKGKPQFEFQKL